MSDISDHALLLSDEPFAEKKQDDEDQQNRIIPQFSFFNERGLPDFTLKSGYGSY